MKLNDGRRYRVKTFAYQNEHGGTELMDNCFALIDVFRSWHDYECGWRAAGRVHGPIVVGVVGGGIARVDCLTGEEAFIDECDVLEDVGPGAWRSCECCNDDYRPGHKFLCRRCEQDSN